MADDLRHFLTGEPIICRKSGLAESMVRSLCRHPGRCAAVLAVLAILAVASTQRFELQRPGQRLDRHDRRELRRVINRTHEVGLRRSIELGENLIRDHSESRERRPRLASIYHRLGELLVNTDRLADALWTYERAATLLRQHLRDEPGDLTSQMELADVLGSLGEASWPSAGRAMPGRCIVPPSSFARAWLQLIPKIRATGTT